MKRQKGSALAETSVVLLVLAGIGMWCTNAGLFVLPHVPVFGYGLF